MEPERVPSQSLLVRISNTSGRIVFEKMYPPHQQKMLLDTTLLPSGMYQLRVSGIQSSMNIPVVIIK
ncbi:MAG: hypothetical protein IPL65_02200 [Lewinellaceae bacterium]|nr:hypothetical protein [Lewinellaceae bacterium]